MKNFMLIVISFTLLNCQNDTDTSQNGSTDTASNNESIYRGVPNSLIQRLVNDCDYIDYILYNYDFSLSQNEKNQIMAAIQQIGPVFQGNHQTCQSIGRVFFQAKGENIAEADIYFSDGCLLYFFLDEGKPTYANQLSDVGVAFYNQIFNNFNSHGKE